MEFEERLFILFPTRSFKAKGMKHNLRTFSGILGKCIMPQGSAKSPRTNTHL